MTSDAPTASPHADSSAALTRVFREEWGQVLATLIRLVGDFDLAEEVLQEATVVALERWPVDGVPAKPGGWLLTTARRKALDRLRREANREAKQRAAYMLATRDADDEVEMSVIRDDQLRLIFTCCHPALATEAQVALTLRTLGGLSTREIARAFLVPETSRTASHPTMCSPRGCPRFSPSCTSSSTRDTAPRPATS